MSWVRDRLQSFLKPNSSDPADKRSGTVAAGAFALAVAPTALVLGVSVWLYRAGNGGGPDLAAWIEALATLAAVFIATLGAAYAFRAYVIEERRELRILTDIRQQQAARVAAWHAFGGRGDPYGYVALRNASDLPVTGVEVAVEMWGMTEQGPMHDEVPERKLVWSEWLPVATLPPASDPQPLELNDYQGLNNAFQGLQGGGQSAEFQVAVSFRDSNNVWWHRNAEGVLSEYPHQQPDRSEGPGSGLGVSVEDVT